MQLLFAAERDSTILPVVAEERIAAARKALASQEYAQAAAILESLVAQYPESERVLSSMLLFACEVHELSVMAEMTQRILALRNDESLQAVSTAATAFYNHLRAPRYVNIANQAEFQAPNWLNVAEKRSPQSIYAIAMTADMKIPADDTAIELVLLSYFDQFQNKDIESAIMSEIRRMLASSGFLVLKFPPSYALRDLLARHAFTLLSADTDQICRRFADIPNIAVQKTHCQYAIAVPE